MHDRAFMIAGDQAALIANDIEDFRYLATGLNVPVGVQAPARSNGAAETQFMIEDGTLEFMVGGASTFITAGGFVRVPPGVHYGYRNIADEPAHLLVRTVRPEPTYKMIRAYIEYAA